MLSSGPLYADDIRQDAYERSMADSGSVEIYDPDRDQVPQDPGGHGTVEAVRDVVRARNLKPVYQRLLGGEQPPC